MVSCDFGRTIIKRGQPDGANIFKYPDGEPTGFVADATAFIERLPLRERSPQKYHDAFLKFQDICNSYGITAVDLAGPTIPAEQAWKAFNDMEKAGELKVRVNCTIMSYYDATVNKERGREYVKLLDDGQEYNSDFQRVTQAKGIIDGVPEAKSDRLMEPYAPEAGEAPDFIGPAYIDPEDLIGTIEVGKKADMVVLAQFILDCDVKTIAETKVCCTIMNGDIVYEG